MYAACLGRMDDRPESGGETGEYSGGAVSGVLSACSCTSSSLGFLAWREKLRGLGVRFIGKLSLLLSGGEWRGEAKAPLFGAVMFLAPKRESRGLLNCLRRLELRLFLIQMNRMAKIARITTDPAKAMPTMTPGVIIL